MIKYFLIVLFFQSIIISSELITPIPQHISVDHEKMELGKKLYFDTVLSKDNSVSCATCHQLESGGDDNMKVSLGIDAQSGSINAPTVYNAVFNFRQFWDGRAKDLQEQALGPIQNPIEMGHNFDLLIPILQKTQYKQMFEKLYTDGITAQNIANAIAEYEKTLITPNAPFDRYLRGEDDALSEYEKEGYSLFKAKGCIACHHGVNIGGNTYNKFGIFHDANSSSLGRFNVTGLQRDKYFFKVPSLRNIEKTAPYFHDGRTDDLYTTVEIMAQYQLGRKITSQEIKKIVAFLKSLNGELPQGVEQ